jgi:hypothetical protein
MGYLKIVATRILTQLNIIDKSRYLTISPLFKRKLKQSSTKLNMTKDELLIVWNRIVHATIFELDAAM